MAKDKKEAAYLLEEASGILYKEEGLNHYVYDAYNEKWIVDEYDSFDIHFCGIGVKELDEKQANAEMQRQNKLTREFKKEEKIIKEIFKILEKKYCYKSIVEEDLWEAVSELFNLKEDGEIKVKMFNYLLSLDIDDYYQIISKYINIDDVDEKKILDGKLFELITNKPI